jgi:hypothetical protein
MLFEFQITLAYQTLPLVFWPSNLLTFQPYVVCNWATGGAKCRAETCPTVWPTQHRQPKTVVRFASSSPSEKRPPLTRRDEPGKQPFLHQRSGAPVRGVARGPRREKRTHIRIRPRVALLTANSRPITTAPSGPWLHIEDVSLPVVQVVCKPSRTPPSVCLAFLSFSGRFTPFASSTVPCRR